MTNYTTCKQCLEEAQESEYDNRLRMTDADAFIHSEEGQWESSVVSQIADRPKYTFDECSPIIDDIMSYLNRRDFNITVQPTGTDGSAKTAKAYEGIIRRIRNVSSSRHIFNAAAKTYVITGMAGWEVQHTYVDENSFDMELVIAPIHNARNNLWFDTNAKLQSMADASKGWKLIAMSKREYDREFPKGSGISVPDDRSREVYSYKPDQVVIGSYFYKVRKKKTLVLLSNGAIYEVDDDFQAIYDELQMQGVQVVEERERVSHEVYHRYFDGNDFLTEAKPTVFNYIPLVPVFGNFVVTENKIVYYGAIYKLMDSQRVLNYAESRKIEDSALAPKGKMWMTKRQAKSSDVRSTLQTLNVNNDPVQFYDHEGNAPPPFYTGAPQPSPILLEVASSQRQFIERYSSLYDSARGEAPSGRSGEAIELLQRRSDSPKEKWVTPLEIAMEHTSRIIVMAAPKVYSARQEVDIQSEDGTIETITINDQIFDQQTQRTVEINNLKRGTYHVSCKAGQVYASRQQQTISALMEIATIDPTILQLGGDILLKSIQAPGVELLAERRRIQMLLQGLIPQSQMTKEEQAMLKQVEENKKANKDLSPLDQANLMIAQAELQETQGKNQERALKIQLEGQKLQLREFELSLKAQEAQTKASLQATTEMVKLIQTQAETLKAIKEAMGADAIVSPTVVRAYDEQAMDLLKSLKQ